MDVKSIIENDNGEAVFVEVDGIICKRIEKEDLLWNLCDGCIFKGGTKNSDCVNYEFIQCEEFNKHYIYVPVEKERE